MDWIDKTILITGGTGSLGKKLIGVLLQKHHPRKIIVFSRGEVKQHEMRMSDFDHSSLRYFIGDVRDQNRLNRAFQDVDIVVHAAALKQVPACEYNPFEAVLTNVMGAKNVIDAALNQGVGTVMAISSDKAVNPCNLYGGTKLVAEKMFVQANVYSGLDGTKFSLCRYGNVIGSRGSVIPKFLEQQKSGTISITDSRMTRFWITLDQSAEFIIQCLDKMQGGEIFVPKIPSMTITGLAEAIAPDCEIEFVGIRPGEKLHEILISEDEARHIEEQNDMYIIRPVYQQGQGKRPIDDKPLFGGLSFTSESNEQWLSVEELRGLIE